jgi:hypothetical protein
MTLGVDAEQTVQLNTHKHKSEFTTLYFREIKAGLFSQLLFERLLNVVNTE